MFPRKLWLFCVSCISGAIVFVCWASTYGPTHTTTFDLYNYLASMSQVRNYRCHNNGRNLNDWDYFLKSVLYADVLYRNINTTGYVPDLQNWTNMQLAFQQYLIEYLMRNDQKSTTEPIRIIEVGSWKGGSALAMAKICRKYAFPRNCTILAIDTWLGAPIVYTDRTAIIHTEFAEGKGRLKLFDKFLNNVIVHNASDIITPFRQPSLGAAHVLHCFQMKADMIYIDGDHEYEGIKADLTAYYPLVKDGGLFFGDDAPNPHVRRALDEFISSMGGKLQLMDWRKEKWTWVAWNRT